MKKQESVRILEAKQILGEPPKDPESRKESAIRLAAIMLEESHSLQSTEELNRQKELALMMADIEGKAFVTAMADQSFRSHINSRIADQLAYNISKFGIPRFLAWTKKIQFLLFEAYGRILPFLFVPIAKKMIRKKTLQVILPGEYKALKQHILNRKSQGISVNLNRLGEAILGEEEASRRLQIYLEDLKQDEVNYISVKISTLFSQINLLAWEETQKILSERLRILFRAARNKFVNLDMEEYRDLELTIDVFCTTLDEPEFIQTSAGIVLQSYLPESYTLQEKITVWAKNRISKGGAPIKIRIVKGANLAMEKVEASLHQWPQAPYNDKSDVDANFKKMLIYGCQPENAAAVHLGIGSHNLFDIAYALLLCADNKVQKFVTFEMLEGMADSMRKVVQKLTGNILLYCPVTTEADFQNAIAYLIRRLDENTAPENFLRYSFDLHPGTKEWNEQVQRFTQSCQKISTIENRPRRTQNRFGEPSKPDMDGPFENEPDTDWSQEKNRIWAKEIIAHWHKKKQDQIPIVIAGKEIKTLSEGKGEDPSRPGHLLYTYTKADLSHVEEALQAAKKAEYSWKTTSIYERSNLLANVAQEFRKSRSELIGAMVADTGKTISEADAEVSEAIDFLEYYRRVAEELSILNDLRFTPKGTILVTPPWNFPCSIPVSGISAALAAGNCVIFKPAPEAILVGWYVVNLFWKAGVSRNVLQFITCDDEPTGSALIKDSRINAVLLTGSTETAKLMLSLRPGLDLMAETGGKNSLIVTGMADRDLAVRDIIHSSFGYSGQKCSACSLAILEAEVYDDPHFLRQLRDAAASLKVGSAWSLDTRVNPLIRIPNDILMKGLTELEEGEEWLLKPVQNLENPQLWSPGIKIGVNQNSFSYQNELFGPVLSVIRAKNIKHAIELVNGTPYGLTAGLHSLDEREHEYWKENIVAGNLYINRGITGAIVRRQPFGGCKVSSFGPGAKAGGPNYVLQLGNFTQLSLPHSCQCLPRVEILELSKNMHNRFSQAVNDIWNASITSYHFNWHHYFNKSHDPSSVLGQENLFGYIPCRKMLLRVTQTDAIPDVLRVIAAATICGTSLEVSIDFKDELNSYDLKNFPLLTIHEETEKQLMIRMKIFDRIRFLSLPSDALQDFLSKNGISASIKPVLANGRIELLNYLREVTLSHDYHRYGYLGLHKN